MLNTLITSNELEETDRAKAKSSSSSRSCSSSDKSSLRLRMRVVCLPKEKVDSSISGLSKSSSNEESPQESHNGAVQLLNVL